MNREHFQRALQDAAERRLSAAQEERRTIAILNEIVKAARRDGMPVQEIAREIGTTRQRVYEILRGP